jgi:hypothetical protein
LVILVTWLTACGDREDMVSFEAVNNYSDTIYLKFSRYKDPSAYHAVVDTSFTIPPQGREVVYFDSGLVLPQDRYMINDSMQFCESIILITGNKVSSKNFLVKEEWDYKSHTYEKYYTLIITESDF